MGPRPLIEEQGGGDVDINNDDGGFSVQTEDGSMTVEGEDGGFSSGTVEGEDFLDEYGSALGAAGFESNSEFSADGTANCMYSSATWNVGISYAENESGNQVTISVYAAE